jgi:hypothetical protein
MAEDNPLVATAPQTSWDGMAHIKAPTSFTNAGTDLEGAGLFSDAASTLSDATTAKGWADGAAEMDLVSDGMDAIGVAMDPFGSLAGAGIGWLIEHIGFLKKPLDYLAGDPEEITAKQQTWENIAKALNDAAGQYEQSASTMKGSNQGAAVNGVHSTGTNFSQVLKGAASHASDAAEAMKVAGVVVGTTRGVIRDSLSQFAGDAIVKWIAATAAAFFTFGATEAAFVVDEVAEGTSLAVQDVSKVTKVMQFLEKLTGKAKDSSSALEKASSSIAKDSGKDVAETAGKDTAKTAAKDTGRTAPKDTAESTTPSSASDGSATVKDQGSTAPKDTGESTSPSSASDGSATVKDEGTTAPTDTGESTTPSSASDGSSATVKDEGTTAPSDAAATKEPTPEQIKQQADDHVQARDAHNQAVAQHNADAASFRAQSAEHNTKAIENTQKMSENAHARDMNQQAINRARAQGKPHDDLKAQHRQLESEHKSLRQEDTRLSSEQKQLEQRHQELNSNAKDINANAKHLNAEQAKLKHDVGESWLKEHSLRSEQYEGSKAQLAGEHLSDDSKGMHNLSTYDPKKLLDPAGWKPSTVLHDGLPGVPKPTLGDAAGVAKEAGHQALSDQPTREGKIEEEYHLKQEELAHQAQESGGEQKPAWPTSEQTPA